MEETFELVDLINEAGEETYIFRPILTSPRGFGGLKSLKGELYLYKDNKPTLFLSEEFKGKNVSELYKAMRIAILRKIIYGI